MSACSQIHAGYTCLMKVKSYYKVLYRDKNTGELCSALDNGPWTCKYTPFEWTVGKEGTLLFVYTCRRCAASFRASFVSRRYELWEGLATGVFSMSWEQFDKAPLRHEWEKKLIPFWRTVKLGSESQREKDAVLVVKRFMPLVRIQ